MVYTSTDGKRSIRVVSITQQATIANNALGAVRRAVQLGYAHTLTIELMRRAVVEADKLAAMQSASQ